ncbi:MAG TPA: glycerol-3-phosphate dehydrogenase, partial [Stellaceae bacterium]|nr:glycerol-3-phosphate dehydrogenase [Stellaceae bacterium]
AMLAAMSESFDLLVVGGGINGVGIARDAAGRGLKVLLCERGDLAGATSSASSKMIHGGLRYLEHFAFRLVRESLAEREVLLHAAPHLVRPMRFVLPHGGGQRPRWMLRAGLFLYDRLGGARSLPASAAVDLRSGPLGAPLRETVRDGFVYSDCVVDDARLTVANARDAARLGAEIATRSALVAARREGAAWRATLQPEDGPARDVAARILVNAAGPWVADVLRRAGLASRARLRLDKGSHIVVPRLYPHDHAYLLQNDDGRVVFAIPFEHDYTLIGTTEATVDSAEAPQATPEEVAYLCRAVGRWFKHPPTPQDVVWRYAGVRPLYDDGATSAAATSRDYVFELDAAGAPALSVFGGKLTTYRRLAEAALARLAPHLPGAGPPWTHAAALPSDDFAAPGEAEFGPGLGRAEAAWLIREEWARSADDILWRRSKLGLRVSPEQRAALEDYLSSCAGASAPTTAPAHSSARTPD